MVINPVGQGSVTTQAAMPVMESSMSARIGQKQERKHHQGRHQKGAPQHPGQTEDTAQISDEAKELASSSTRQSDDSSSKPTA
jgi:hypothetical protein